MIVHQVYAIIDPDGTIQNVMVCDNYEDANQISRAVYGDSAIAVDCLQYPCGPGDRYHDGRFWHVGEDGAETEIAYVPTQEQQVAALKKESTVYMQAAKMAAIGFTDRQALTVKSLYPVWAELTDGTILTKPEEATSGIEITRVVGNDGLLYRVLTTHAKQSNWAPGQKTASLFTVIDEAHEGTQADPIPYSVNMVVYEGKYYIYEEVLYRCIRDSEIALQYTPAQLIGQYFEVIE